MTVPSFTGADLTGLAFEGADTIRIDLIDTDGRPVSIRLEGVDAFQANDIKQGNVVEAVEVTNDLHRVVARLRHAFTPPSWDEGRWVDTMRERVREDGLFFFGLTPGYGAAMAGLCRRVEVTEAAPRAASQAA